MWWPEPGSPTGPPPGPGGRSSRPVSGHLTQRFSGVSRLAGTTGSSGAIDVRDPVHRARVHGGSCSGSCASGRRLGAARRTPDARRRAALAATASTVPAVAVPFASSGVGDLVHQRRADHHGVGDAGDRLRRARAFFMPKPTATGRPDGALTRATAGADAWRSRLPRRRSRRPPRRNRRSRRCGEHGRQALVVGGRRRQPDQASAGASSASAAEPSASSGGQSTTIRPSTPAAARVAGEALEAVGIDRVQVAHQDDRRVGVALAEAAHQRPASAAASCRPSSARWPARWIGGPSAMGSENGKPSSIRSAPAAGRRLEDRQRGRRRPGSPAITIGDEGGAALAPSAAAKRRSMRVLVGAHILPPRCSATVAMSLSPRPERLSTMMPSLPTSWPRSRPAGRARGRAPGPG